MQPFNINLTEHGPWTCSRGESWGTYKDVVNCNTCAVPGLRITKESIWGFFETRAPEDRLGLPLERAKEVGGELCPISPAAVAARIQQLPCAVHAPCLVAT